MSYEEALRRSLVVAVKKLGTLIREEELRRQALTANVNKPIAENLLQTVEDILAKMPDIEKEISSAITTAIKEGKPILEAALQELVKSMLESLPIAVISLERVKTVLREVNEQIDVANRILEEINKAGVYTPKLQSVSHKDDYVSLLLALKASRERLRVIIDFYSELEKFLEK